MVTKHGKQAFECLDRRRDYRLPSERQSSLISSEGVEELRRR